MKMTPRERVLAALDHEPAGRTPWIEGIVQDEIASVVCGGPILVDWSVAPDGFPKQSGAALAEEQKKVDTVRGVQAGNEQSHVSRGRQPSVAPKVLGDFHGVPEQPI